MVTRVPRYSKEEFARRGDEIYQRDIKPVVEPDNIGKFVAIDIESGEWEMDANEMEAGDRLFERVPDAQTWMVRVGSRWVHRFGGRRPRAQE
jgi:hypothetical protein